MYQNPTLFPQVSNRETWLQIVQIVDDDTGDAIALQDSNGAPLYDVRLEITPSGSHGNSRGIWPNQYYDDDCGPQISASLADYISLIDTGTLQIQIPKSVMTSLRSRTYDVFLTITDVASDDGRQVLIGKLPVLYGGRNT